MPWATWLEKWSRSHSSSGHPSLSMSGVGRRVRAACYILPHPPSPRWPSPFPQPGTPSPCSEKESSEEEVETGLIST